jgi:hypothetical protein
MKAPTVTEPLHSKIACRKEGVIDDVPLRSVQPRYVEMQRLFDEVGPNVRRMTI